MLLRGVAAAFPCAALLSGLATPVLRAASSPFDDVLRGVLLEAERVGVSAAVSAWLDEMDEDFIPALGAEIDKAADAGHDYAAMWDILSA
eukprot:452432-Prymnesium_polylepis.1